MDTDARRDWGWGVLVVSFVVFMAAMFKPWIHGADGVRYYAYLRSAAIDGDLDFEDEFSHYPDAAGVLRRDPRTGRVANAVACGSAVLWAPWFLAAHAGVKIARLAGASVAADGYSAPYVVAVCLGSTFYALAGLLLLYGALRRWAGQGAALTAVMGVWLASPLVFYMCSHPSMSHANAFFCVCALLAACVRWGESESFAAWAGMGALAGLATLARFDNLLWLALPAAQWISWFVVRGSWFARRDSRRVVVGRDRSRQTFFAPINEPRTANHEPRSVLRFLALGAVFCVCALAVFSPQLFAWKALYGSFFSGPRDYKLDPDLSVWSSPHFLDALFSGRRGLFFWTPIALAGVAGWTLRSPIPARLRSAAAAILLAQTWLVGGWAVWWGGASFGPRLFIGCLPLLALGLAALVERTRSRWRAIALAATALLVVWNFGLMAQYALRIVDREGDLTRREVLANQFTRVPVELWRRMGDVLRRRPV